MRPVRLSALLLLCLAVPACKPGPKPVVAQSPTQTAPQAPGLPNGTLTGPAGAPPLTATAPSANATSASTDKDSLRCDQQIGKAGATRLADRCLMVSPASHPPCNVANACEMIRDEIKRSCDLFAADKPKECTG